MTKIEQAKAFAHQAHDSIGQRRKYSGEPYWVHTDAVAEIVASVTSNEDMIVAAHLHDVLEDVTPLKPEYSREQIETLFGPVVLKLVIELTDVYTKEAYPEWNRAKRHTAELERKKGLSADAQTIKLADGLHNTGSIVAEDPGFAKTFLKEMLDGLPYLSDGNPILLQRLSIQVIVACANLGVTIPTITA